MTLISLRGRNGLGIAHLVRGLAYSALGQSSDAELDFNSAAAFSESEMESFKNVFGVIDSPFKNTRAMLSEETTELLVLVTNQVNITALIGISQARGNW